MRSIYSKLQQIHAGSLFYQICYYSITTILLVSGITKIMDPGPLLETLAVITILPEAFAVLLATLLPVLETGLAVLMVMRIQPKFTLPAVCMLFGGFLLFSIYGVATGIDADCGCFGSAISSEFGLGMIVRNIGFVGMTGWLLFYNKGNENKESASKSIRQGE